MDAPPGATTKPKSGLSIVMVWGLVALAVGWYFIARSGKSVSTAIAGPTTLANERVQLHEGQWKAYRVLLDAPRKVAVHVDAAPMAVDVVTMAKEEYDQFEKVHKALFGGRYKHIPALSSKRVTKYDGETILGQGSWYIVVMRPHESLAFGDDTNAQVTVLAY